MSLKLVANATRSPDGTYAARVIRAHDHVAIMTANGYPNAFAALDSAKAHIAALDNPAADEAPVACAIETVKWLAGFIAAYVYKAPLAATVARGFDLLETVAEWQRTLTHAGHSVHYAAMLEAVTDDASPAINATLV